MPLPLPPLYPVTRRVAAAVVSGLAAAGASDPALGHGGFEGVGAFYGGLLHPVAVSAHLLAAVAIGLYGGQRGWSFVVAALPFLAAGVLVGLVLARPAFEPFAVPALLVSAAATGLAVAFEARPPAALAIGWMALTGAVVAADSPADTAVTDLAARAFSGPGGDLAALAGTGIGILLLYAWSAMPISRLHVPWQRIGIRVFGSWLAAGATISLVLAVTGRGA